MQTCCMPKLNSSRIKHRIAELDWSVEQVASMTGIPYGTLRNAVAGRDPINLHRAYRLLRALNVPGYVQLSIDDLLVGDQKPTEPPQQPKGPKSPPTRQEREPSRGPRRVAVA